MNSKLEELRKAAADEDAGLCIVADNLVNRSAVEIEARLRGFKGCELSRIFTRLRERFPERTRALRIVGRLWRRACPADWPITCPAPEPFPITPEWVEQLVKAPLSVVPRWLDYESPERLSAVLSYLRTHHPDKTELYGRVRDRFFFESAGLPKHNALRAAVKADEDRHSASCPVEDLGLARCAEHLAKLQEVEKKFGSILPAGELAAHVAAFDADRFDGWLAAESTPNLSGVFGVFRKSPRKFSPMRLLRIERELDRRAETHEQKVARLGAELRVEDRRLLRVAEEVYGATRDGVRVILGKEHPAAIAQVSTVLKKRFPTHYKLHDLVASIWQEVRAKFEADRQLAPAPEAAVKPEALGSLVAALEAREAELHRLCGEILATLRTNVSRGRLHTPGVAAEFEQLLAGWQRSFAETNLNKLNK